MNEKKPKYTIIYSIESRHVSRIHFRRIRAQRNLSTFFVVRLIDLRIITILMRNLYFVFTENGFPKNWNHDCLPGILFL